MALHNSWAEHDPKETRVIQHMPEIGAVRSGMFRGQSRFPKCGNARLRRMLWMAGQAAVLKGANSFRDRFERYISKDRHNAHLRRKARTAIAAKMACTGICRDQTRCPLSPCLRGGRRKNLSLT